MPSTATTEAACDDGQRLRVLVPYTRLTRGCEESLERYAPQAERVYVGGDPLDYWRLLCRVWADGEDFILIEHDMTFEAAALEALKACPEPVCSAALHFRLIRFRSEVMRDQPRVFEDIRMSERHWLALEHCLRLHQRLAAHRHRAHPDPWNDSGRRWIDHPDRRWVAWSDWLRTLPPSEADGWTARAWARVNMVQRPDGSVQDDGCACSFPGCWRAGRTTAAFATTCHRCRRDTPSVTVT